MKRLGFYIKEEKISQLTELLNKKIWFARCPNLSIDLTEKIYTSSCFQMPFYWKNNLGVQESKIIKFISEWYEDEETLLDYYNIKIEIFDFDNIIENFESLLNRDKQIGLNSGISFSDFNINQIQILSTEEIVDDIAETPIELKYDEGILFIESEERKILFSSDNKCTGLIEFINDLSIIENRIKKLNVRKNIG